MKKFITVIFIVFLCNSAAAQTRFHTELKYGIRLYRYENYNKSIEVLTAFIENPKVDKKKFIDAYLYLAFNHLKLNKQYLAEPALEELLKLNPDYELNLAEFGKEEAEFFHEMKEISLGSIQVITVPDSAEIYMDDTYYGKTPLLIRNIFSDDYEITIVKGGHEIIQEPVSVFPQEVITISRRLIWDNSLAVTKVITEPPGATLILDDFYKGQTPLFIKSIEGRYVIKFEKEGYKDLVMTKEMKAHELNEVNVKLTKEKDYFIHSMIVPGLSQFVKGYKTHGLMCCFAFAGYIYFFKNYFPEKPPKYVHKLRQYNPHPGSYSSYTYSSYYFYYIDGKRVFKQEWDEEWSKKLEIEARWNDYNEKRWKFITVGVALYALNLLDAYLVLRHDDKKKEREQLRELGFEWNEDRVMVSMRFLF